MGEENREKPLEDCLETVQRLEEENQYLRRSAGEFGQLAERLNVMLREERRVAADDRRRQPRIRADRRQ